MSDFNTVPNARTFQVPTFTFRPSNDLGLQNYQDNADPFSGFNYQDSFQQSGNVAENGFFFNRQQALRNFNFLRDAQNDNQTQNSTTTQSQTTTPSQSENSTQTPQQAQTRNVVVMPGDTLSGLLLKAGYPKSQAFDPKFQDQVASQNKLADKNKIRAGQSLTIPVPAKSQESQENKPSSQTNDSSQTPDKDEKKTEPSKKPVAKKPVSKTNPKNQPSKTNKVQKKPVASKEWAINKAKAHLDSQKINGRQFLQYSASANPKDPGEMRVTAVMPENITPGGYTIEMKVVNGNVSIVSSGFRKK